MAPYYRLTDLLVAILIFQWLGNGVLAVHYSDEMDINPQDFKSLAEVPVPGFGDVVQIAGGMVRTDQDFKDGLIIDVFSPKARTVVVTQNMTPLGATFVSGTQGENFVAISNYSYQIKTNDSANDLIAKIEIPFQPQMLDQMNVSSANTFVAVLAPDGRSWVVDDQLRNVHVTQNTTRLIKMTQIDGEYILVGRKEVDTSNIFLQFGNGQTRTVHLAAGIGTQQSEWIDGLRFNIQSEQQMQFNVNLRPGINPGTLPAGTEPLNTYAWVINSSQPFGKMDVTMSVPCMYSPLSSTFYMNSRLTNFPVNRAMLAAMRPSGFSPSTMLTVYKRPLNASSGVFQPLLADNQVVRELPEDRIEITKMTQLDGVYVILVTPPKPVGETGVMPTILGGPGGSMEVKSEMVVDGYIAETDGSMEKRSITSPRMRYYKKRGWRLEGGAEDSN
ncbi:hypothetical protein HYFRA_00007584 [Hymenoscyphus fraxineus]|uniref:Uncharacterized protein n=1 Tax=Hymenoscyphus fraxineus TaxID=746836 RepID=A0A9N9KRM5_9HELO|nr:hypothetical protein HYFRA_00007584 [Hymenoscyphus fraxineus]